MKNILFIAVLIATLNCKAQSPIVSMVDFENNDDLELTDGCYLKDVENKFFPFLGTWTWIDNNNEFTITFTKLEAVYNSGGNYYSDYLIGKYKYIENGVEIVNTTNYNGINANNFFSSDGFPYVIEGSGYSGDTYMYLGYYDRIKNKNCKASVELLNTLEDLNGNVVATQMQWKLWDKENVTINGEPALPQGFSIPTNVILTKVE